MGRPAIRTGWVLMLLAVLPAGAPALAGFIGVGIGVDVCRKLKSAVAAGAAAQARAAVAPLPPPLLAATPPLSCPETEGSRTGAVRVAEAARVAGALAAPRAGTAYFPTVYVRFKEDDDVDVEKVEVTTRCLLLSLLPLLPLLLTPWKLLLPLLLAAAFVAVEPDRVLCDADEDDCLHGPFGKE